jgi:DNA-binding MarR family transcriptional regulator
MTASAPLSDDEWAMWDVWMRAQRVLSREAERALQSDFGISKAEFGIMVTLESAPDLPMRVSSLAESLGWEKSRVAHQLTRMERRGLVVRSESGAAGRRTGIALTAAGKALAEKSIVGHGRNIRRLALDTLSPEQAAVITEWSRQMIERLELNGGAPIDDRSAIGS